MPLLRQRGSKSSYLVRQRALLGGSNTHAPAKELGPPQLSAHWSDGGGFCASIGIWRVGRVAVHVVKAGRC
jgi:hypothetical protein